MTDEVLLFVYATLAAVILIAIVAYYYMPTLVGATQAQAEYVALRDIAPTLILAQDGKSVHICINATSPQRVYIQKSGVLMDAQKDCHINPGGQCVPGRGMGRHQNWPFCKWYLGNYKPGENITIILKTDHATVVKSYRIGAIKPSAKLDASNMGGQNNAGQNGSGGQGGGQNGSGQSGAQVTTVTITGTVYSSTVATVTTTVTSYSTTTTTVTAPTTVTVTYTVVVQDPSFTTTRTLTTCKPDTTTTSSTTWFPPVEQGRYGFQLATTSTVTSYTTIYTTSYVTSTVTTTVWSTVTSTYTPTTTTTVTNLRPGVEVICYICSTSTPSKTCSTTTLVSTTTTITTITGSTGYTQSNTPDRGLSIDTFFLGLSAVVMMASSVMLVKKQ